MHSLVEAAAEPAEEDDGVLLREVVLAEGARVTVAEPAYLDMAFGLLVVDERADALHEVRRVLVAVAHDAHAARGVVRAHVVPQGVEVALDEVRGVPVRARASSGGAGRGRRGGRDGLTDGGGPCRRSRGGGRGGGWRRRQRRRAIGRRARRGGGGRRRRAG